MSAGFFFFENTLRNRKYSCVAKENQQVEFSKWSDPMRAPSRTENGHTKPSEHVSKTVGRGGTHRKKKKKMRV
jgi:hypothetical protein